MARRGIELDLPQMEHRRHRENDLKRIECCFLVSEHDINLGQVLKAIGQGGKVRTLWVQLNRPDRVRLAPQASVGQAKRATASTALANSASMLSPGESTTRP